MKIIKYQEQYLESLNLLLQESFEVNKKENFSSDNIELIAVNDLEVIGYLVLNICLDAVLGIKYAYVNYVCVKEEYRGQHIASMMFETVFSICKEENISYLELTSKATRVAAHHLYKKLGFEVRETTVFRKEIL